MLSSRSLALALGVLIWSVSWPRPAAAVVSSEGGLPGGGASSVGSPTSTALPDILPPSIRASVLPPPNAAGWHNATVRLVYTCFDAQSGVARCPAETVVDAEGAGRTVTSVAADQAGNEAASSVNLSIDRTPPVLRMTSPTHGQVVTGPKVTVTGTVTDELSGVAGARCNGVPAAVTSGAVVCTVAVRPGFNAVVLQVSDWAGNVAIAGVRVVVAAPPSRVTIAPHRATLVPGDRRDFRLLDQSGVPVVGATWTTNDTDILSVSATDDGVEASARAVGTATILAEWNGLTTEALVTVMEPSDRGTLPYGTRRWVLQNVDPSGTQKVVYAKRVDVDGPDMFVLETAPTAATLRGVMSSGIPLNPWSVPVEAKAVLADRDGGVLLITGQSRGLLRVPGSEAGRPWWYVAEGVREIRAGVQAPDGTIFIVETADDAWGTNTLVGLDGRTGAVRFRILSLGRLRDRTVEGEGLDSVADFGVRAAPIDPLIFGYDAGYVGTYSAERSTERRTGLRTDHVEAHLMRVEPDGTATTIKMEARDFTGPASCPPLTVAMGPVIPDPRGGAHVQWRFSNGAELSPPRHGRGGFEGAPTSVEDPLPFSRVGDALTGYDETGTGYDMETGTVRFRTPPGSKFVAALVGGGVAYSLGAELIQTDAVGRVVKTSPMPGSSADAAAARKSPDR